MNIFLVLVNGENQNPCFRCEFPDLLRGFNAVEDGHGNVEDRDIGLSCFCQPDCLIAVGCFSDDGEMRIALEYPAESVADDGMVVSDQEPDLFPLLLSTLRGISTLTKTPWCGSDWTWNVPPRSSARLLTASVSESLQRVWTAERTKVLP